MKNVLTLFNGMGCAEIILKELGIEHQAYASEVDKFALQAAKQNFPNTIQLGDVTTIDSLKLPKIWLLCGGSPCQSFSFAGKMKGMITTTEERITSLEKYLKLKKEGFEFEGQSYLFWEFVRLLHETKPTYFFLENVVMEKKWENIITNTLGVEPILVDAALVSAQSRKRLFWTNIGIAQEIEFDLFGNPKLQRSNIKLPKDHGIVLRDILEENVDKKYYLSQKMLSYFERNTKKMKEQGKGLAFKVKPETEKSFTITTKEGSRMQNTFISQLPRGFNQGADFHEKSPTLTSNSWQHNNFVLTKNYVQLDSSGKNHKSQNDRYYFEDGKHGTLSANRGETKTGVYQNETIRRLTPTECRRLQSIPDWYSFEGVSEAQQYKMLGNGWNVEQVKIFFKYLC